MKLPVQAPKLRPACHGLIESGNDVTPSDKRWENGITFRPIGCYGLGGTEQDCPPIEKEELQSCVEPVEFRPYVITLGFEWAANDPDDPIALATAMLEVGTSPQLEEFLYSGSSAGAGPRNPKLVDATGIGTADRARQALGMVEDAMVSQATGGAGTVYMSPSVASDSGDAIYENDGKLYTKATCSLVIVGNFPDDVVVGHVGDVDLYIGDIFVTDTRDEYRSNEYDVMAERLAIAAYNSCAAYKATFVPPT